MKRILRICNLICNKVPILRNVFHPGRYIVCFELEICTTLVDQVMARVMVRVRVSLWLRLCLLCGCAHTHNWKSGFKQFTLLVNHACILSIRILVLSGICMWEYTLVIVDSNSVH